jgi:hypothetical protein
LTVVLAVGCGAGKFPIVIAHPSVRSNGIPSAVLPRLRGNRAVLISPSSVAFMTSGSVSCAWWPAQLTVLGPSAIQIDMRVNGRVSACGSGAVGFPIAVKIDPRTVDVHRPVSVRLAYQVHLPGGGGTKQWSYTSVAPAVGR